MFNTVLIPPLQSPWSPVTQGPLTGWILTGYGPWPALSLKTPHHYTPFNALLQLCTCCFTHSLKITHSSSTTFIPSFFTLYSPIWLHPRTPALSLQSCSLLVRITVSGPII